MRSLSSRSTRAWAYACQGPAVGTILFENLIGRVEIIFFSRAEGEHGAAATVRTERIGTLVR